MFQCPFNTKYAFIEVYIFREAEIVVTQTCDLGKGLINKGWPPNKKSTYCIKSIFAVGPIPQTGSCHFLSPSLSPQPLRSFPSSLIPPQSPNLTCVATQATNQERENWTRQYLVACT